MLRFAVIFFILALVAFVFGATGIAGVSMDIGKILLTLFLVISVVSVLAGLIMTSNRT